jgi:hypothetical protein
VFLARLQHQDGHERNVQQHRDPQADTFMSAE